MPDHADFLDHTGRTPREYGAVHIHAEPVVRAPSGDAVATVWLQSAFEPLLTTDSLHIVARLAEGQGELSLKRLPLPSLAGGKVVRWRLPLSLQVDVVELLFLVESKLHPKAQRVRPPWKLLDTIEVPNESELQNSLADPFSSIALNIAGAAALSVLSGGGARSLVVPHELPCPCCRMPRRPRCRRRRAPLPPRPSWSMRRGSSLPDSSRK